MFKKSFRPLFLFNSDAGQGGSATSTSDDKKESQDEKKFTQADIDRIIGERVKRGEESAVSKLLESLGVKDADEIKKALKRLQEQEDAAKSELQKANDSVAEWKKKFEKLTADSDANLAKANESLLRAAVMLEAQKQNVDDAEIPSVWREIKDTPKLREKVKQNDDGDFAGVVDVIKEIVKAHPRWLKSQTQRSAGTQTRTDNRNVNTDNKLNDRIGVKF